MTDKPNGLPTTLYDVQPIKARQRRMPPPHSNIFILLHLTLLVATPTPILPSSTGNHPSTNFFFFPLSLFSFSLYPSHQHHPFFTRLLHSEKTNEAHATARPRPEDHLNVFACECVYVCVHLHGADAWKVLVERAREHRHFVLFLSFIKIYTVSYIRQKFITYLIHETA